MNEDEREKKGNIEKLIRYFRTISGRGPQVSKEDYKGWNQTEEQYRKEQDEWLRQVKKKKKKR